MTDLETDRIITGDTFDVLPTLADESVHAVVTDPPYGLAFMGRDWDDFEPSEYQSWCEKWARECKRVLKPGGHLLAFSGNRTHHRLFTGVEDAGFEIRDTLTWHYGSGFPKASDISKTIDKRADAEREVVADNPNARSDEAEARTAGKSQSGETVHAPITKPATDAAKTWDGWKTGLKPATEFVVMARKPFDGATVDSVLEHGTGALNIDETRIGTEERSFQSSRYSKHKTGEFAIADTSEKNMSPEKSVEGRYPSNVVFDETAAAALDKEVGELAAGHFHDGGRRDDGKGTFHAEDSYDGPGEYGDSGGPSRYFYTSKASRSERTENGAIENDHPTVKPIDLMEWLIKLVTREGQTVLDPFAGSGTTCKAAKGLGRQFLGIEQQPRYADIARVRCGLTPDDPAVVRSDDAQQGFEAYTDGGDSSAE